MSVVNANSVDSDYTPLCAAFDLGLHCLPISLELKQYQNLINPCPAEPGYILPLQKV